MSALRQPAAWCGAGAFLLPALALWLPSGYSWGAALLLLGALRFAPRWLRCRPDAATGVLAALLCLMALLWYQLSALEHTAGRWDRPLKFVLAAVCLLFAAAFPPRPAAFVRGLMAGCTGAGVLALWQVYGQHMARASGFTNAIQWGNIALLMAFWLALHSVVFWAQWGRAQRALALAAVLLGVQASLLSASRGGWLAWGVALPLLCWLAAQMQGAQHHALRRRWLPLAGAALLALLCWANGARLVPRMAEAVQEVGQFASQGVAHTSLGIRLEQYRLAWALIGERPLRGWGTDGFVREMQRRVDAGEYDAAIREYNFVHNEMLDLWAKTGLAGLALQLALYGALLWRFWPTRQRMAQAARGSARWRALLALRASGCLLALCYMVFGLSQQFFVHNSGIMFFAFSLVVLHAALRGQQRGEAPQVP